MIRRRTVIFAGIGVALLLAALVSPFASSAPDGLEAVAARNGIHEAEPAWTAAPIPGYEVPGIAHPRLATGAAGLAGTLAVLGIALAAGRLLARKPQR